MRKTSRSVQKKSTPAPAPVAAVEAKEEALTAPAETAVTAPATAPAEAETPPVKSTKKLATAKSVAPEVPAEVLTKAVVVDTPVEKPKARKKAQAKPVAAKEVKEVKTKTPTPKKAKMVRDSFTIPETDYALFNTLKQRALAAGKEIKKGELLRAGLSVLNALPENELFKVLASVERIKTGRPSK